VLVPVPVPVLVRSTTTSTYVSGGRAPIGGGRQHAMQSSGSSTSGNRAGVWWNWQKATPFAAPHLLPRLLRPSDTSTEAQGNQY
jgi:hypothetical protein